MRRGLFFALLGTLCYSSMLLCAKLTKTVPSEVLVFFRSFVCLMLAASLVIKNKTSLRTSKLSLHIVRSICGFCAAFSFFYAAKHIPLVNALLLFNTTPLFIPIIVYIWHRYKISTTRLLVLFAGFLGIALILKPTFSFYIVASTLGLLGGVFAAFSHTAIATLSKSDKSETILFYFFLGSLVLSSIPTAINFKPINDVKIWCFIILTGIFSGGFQFFITKAYSLVKAPFVASILYFTVAWGAIFEALIWQKIPDTFTILGSILIIGGGVFTVFEKEKTPVIVSSQPVIDDK
jgi:drug/metabolite transporter (DMT)-like permease